MIYKYVLWVWCPKVMVSNLWCIMCTYHVYTYSVVHVYKNTCTQTHVHNNMCTYGCWLYTWIAWIMCTCGHRKLYIRVDTILIVQYQSALNFSATWTLHRMSSSTLDGKLSYAIQTHSNISLMRDSTSTL